MIVKIFITHKFLDWLCSESGMDREEAEEYAQDFISMLHYFGCFPDAAESLSRRVPVDAIENQPGLFPA